MRLATASSWRRLARESGTAVPFGKEILRDRKPKVDTLRKRVEPRGLPVDVFHAAGWRRNRQAVLAQSLDVKSNGGTNLHLDVSDRVAGRHSAWQIRHMGRIVAFRLFNDYRIAHQRSSLRPACFKIVGRLSRDCHATGLNRMLEWTMTTASGDEL